MSSAGGDCTLGEPRDLGPLTAPLVRLALAAGPDGGIVAWLARRGQIGLRPVNGSGAPNGPTRTVELEGALELVWARRDGDGFVIVGYGGGDLIARALDAEGEPTGPPRAAPLAPCRGLLDGGIMGPRPMRSDPRGRLGFDLHPAADGVHLVCPGYQGIVMRHVEVTASTLRVGGRYFGDIRNIKEAIFLGYWVIGDRQRFALVASVFDEDVDPDQNPWPRRAWLHPPGPYPPAGSTHGQGTLVSLRGVPRPLRSAALVEDEVHVITGRDGGPYRLHRFRLDGHRLAEAAELDPSALPPPFRQRLDVALDLDGGDLRLLRHDALGRAVGAPVVLGPAATDGTRFARHFPPARWLWNGHGFVVFWSARDDGEARLRSRTVACPRPDRDRQPPGA